jgi:hypothetical protein
MVGQLGLLHAHRVVAFNNVNCHAYGKALENDGDPADDLCERAQLHLVVIFSEILGVDILLHEVCLPSLLDVFNFEVSRKN